MTHNNKESKKVSESLETRRDYVKEFHESFLKRHPRFGDDTKDCKLPPATTPKSLANVNLDNKEMANTGLNPIELSVLCGTVFGDTSLNIQKKYKNARAQNRHSTRQADWFFWKWLVALPSLSNGLSSISFQSPDGKQAATTPLPGETLGKLKITCAASEKLTTLSKILDKKGNGFSRSWLNHMNNYFLMTLFLDDGSLGRGDQATISLEAFTKEQQTIFVEYLDSVWGIKGNVRQTGLLIKSQNNRPAYRVSFSNEETLKLLRVIAPVVPVESMLYKLYFVPVNNRDVLQRWATELEGLVLPEFRDKVKAHYDKLLH